MKKLFLFSLFSISILFAKDRTTTYFQDDSKNLITAQENIESESKVTPIQNPLPTQNYQKAFYRMFGLMIGIIALIALTFWLMRKFMHAKIRQANESKSIKILEKRIISPKSVLYLIEAEGKKVLISESQQEVRAIHSLNETNELIPQEIEY